jgi:hypothetical protein
MTVTASKLRQNVYKLLDEVIYTGVPLEVKRRGTVLRIVSENTGDKFAHLKKRSVMACPPEALVHIDWSAEWGK